MAPIPVYSSSPINAAKPTGVTPKTADANQGGQAQLEPSQTSGEQVFSPAQPGARPMLPKATGAPQPGGHVLATPTRTSSVGNNPPPPQPGAVPVPPGGGSGTGSNIPPPPRAGESLQNHQSPPVTTMPPQMGYQPPRAPLPVQARSSTASTVGPPPHSGPAGVSAPLQGNYPTAGVSLPAGGYQQDVNAPGYNSYQRAERAYEDEMFTEELAVGKGRQQGTEEPAASAGQLPGVMEMDKLNNAPFVYMHAGHFGKGKDKVGIYDTSFGGFDHTGGEDVVEDEADQTLAAS